MSPERRRRLAERIALQTARAQGLPDFVQDAQTVERLAVLLDVEPCVPKGRDAA